MEKRSKIAVRNIYLICYLIKNLYIQSLQSQEILNRPVFVLEILKKSEH